MCLNKKKFVLIFILSLIVFLALAIPFRSLLKINYVTEVRPAAVLNPVLGIFFGMPAILACVLGNLILDFQSGVPIIQVLAYIIPQFLYGYIPYYVWKKLNKNETDKITIDAMPKILRYIAAVLLGSLALAVIAGTMVGLFNNNTTLLIDFIVFAFVNNIAMNLFLGFPLIILLNKFVNKRKLSSCEKYLLISSVLEAISVCTIICVTWRVTIGIDITDSHFWEKIYLMCIAAILFIIGLSIAIIAVQLDKELKAHSYEFGVAAKIQMSMLPNKFPAFPDRKEFDIFAMMIPAKEVGGDFYDFFMVDDTHVAMVAADVSGKGVSAALFMVIGKTLIKDHTISGADLGDVFADVNNLLCEANSEGLFITAFEGVLDLVTGKFRYVNAGHEMPFICKKNENYKPYPIKAGIILAGMENTKYTSGEFILEPGDKIFEYTDGVTEATNKDKQLFGMKRLEETLSKYSDKSVNELLPLVKKDIDTFVGDAPQFDDITMICLEYNKRMP